jgi:hypothetical protein
MGEEGLVLGWGSYDGVGVDNNIEGDWAKLAARLTMVVAGGAG